MAKRVHELAKELGVKSTAIVAKCQDEGLDIKNHMSTLSAGLEATVREWFSEGDHSTTVERTARVDLEKVRVDKQRRRKAAKEAAEAVAQAESHTDEAPADVAVAEEAPEQPRRISPQERAQAEQEVAATEEAPAAPTPEQPPETPAETSPPTVEAAPPEPDVDVAPSAEPPAAPSPPVESAPEEPPAEETRPAAAVPEEPAPPSHPESPVIERVARGLRPPTEKETSKPKPAEFVPKPAQLQGPKVIRVERPDVVAAPSRGPRRPPRSGPAGAPQPPLPVETGGASARRGKKRPGAETAREEEESRARRNKSQSQSQRRRGRHFEAREGEGVGVHEWSDRDLLERQERLAGASSGRLHGRERRLAKHEESRGPAGVRQRPTAVTVKEPITVKELSAAIGIRANEIIAKLMGMGVMANINQAIDAEAAMAIGLEYDVEVTVEQQKLLLDEIKEKLDLEPPENELKPRPPIVAFLGHVDHGKTSLLDRIRKANVVSGEAGGITQHIGSYLYDDGQRRVTFLDTPGHAAFTAMRARGADMTDIVVLVVAADDGVMPQTEEAINHARAAGVSIVVALNKIDMPNADENKVFGQLSEKGLVPTMWGGDTEVVRTSAATGEGIDDLVEHLDYIAELKDLKAKSDGPAAGWVIESEMDIGQGVLSRLLVKQGELKAGDIIVTGSSFGKVRTIADARGERIATAGPGMPVEVTGLDEVPVAGERFFVLDDIARAREVVEEQRQRRREQTLARRRLVTLENLFSEIAAGELKEFNVIIKADVQGSVDVLVKSVQEMNTSEVAVRVLHAAVGGVTESDVLLAEASNAIIIGFQVIADENARRLAEENGVEIRLYRVIYQITEDMRKALEGMLQPRVEEKEAGALEVRDIFRISRLGVIAGCYVTEGLIKRSAKLRLIRDNIVVRDDLSIETLRRQKDDAAEVRAGLECGIKLAGFDDVQIGDRLEAFELVEVSRTLEPAADGGR